MQDPQGGMAGSEDWHTAKGEVGGVLPVSDASLNQEEKWTRLTKQSHYCPDRCGCVCRFISSYTAYDRL